MRHAPEIIEVDSTQLDDVLRRVEEALPEKDAKLIRAVFQSYACVADLVEDKNTSIRRLRQLFFGGKDQDRGGTRRRAGCSQSAAGNSGGERACNRSRGCPGPGGGRGG